MKRLRFWDVLVVRQDGQWVGFRAPWTALRRAGTIFSLSFFLLVLTATGWILSRWQVEKLRRELSFEKLSRLSLQNQLVSSKSSPPEESSALPLPSSFIKLPNLDAQDITSASFEIGDMQCNYDSHSKDLDLKFEIKRLNPSEGKAQLSWIALLHGTQGLLTFPPVFSSQPGEALLSNRAQPVGDFPSMRNISARFRVPGFLELGRGDPVYVTILVYDERASILLKKRQELNSLSLETKRK